MDQLLIGIDAGGTSTRVLIVDLRGRVRAYVVGAGVHPSQPLESQQHVQGAIQHALTDADASVAQVRSLVAGLAGYNGPATAAWAATCTALPGLVCPQHLVNDATLVHVAAGRPAPAALVLAGTGCNIVGVQADGTWVRATDFHVLPRVPAAVLALHAVLRILAGDAAPADAAFVQAVLVHWAVPTVAALWTLGRQGFRPDPGAYHSQMASLAPIVTTAAAAGSPLAQGVCDRTLAEVWLAVRVVSGGSTVAPVPVVVHGGVIESPYMLDGWRRTLAADERYRPTPLPVAPVVGAVQLAAAQVDQPLDHTHVMEQFHRLARMAT